MSNKLITDVSQFPADNCFVCRRKLTKQSHSFCSFGEYVQGEMTHYAISHNHALIRFPSQTIHSIWYYFDNNSSTIEIVSISTHNASTTNKLVLPFMSLDYSDLSKLETKLNSYLNFQ